MRGLAVPRLNVANQGRMQWRVCIDVNEIELSLNMTVTIFILESDSSLKMKHPRAMHTCREKGDGPERLMYHDFRNATSNI